VSNLNHIRKRVLLVILATVTGNVLVTVTPSLNIASSKYLFSTFANVMMFIVVWDSYFDEKLSQKSTKLILLDLLNITLISAITTLIIFKGITKTIDYLIMIFGLNGWIIAGAIAGLATAIMGIAWSLYCEDLYRNSD
jgi:hypothetical protein